MNKKKDDIIDVNHINPVDFYNKNFVEHTIELLLKKHKALERTSIKSLSFVKNVQDRKQHMIMIDSKTGVFEAEKENGLNMPLGEKYTPFMMLQKFVYKGSWANAVNYVIYDMMNNTSNYMRVGTKYFKRIKKHDRYGVNRTILKYWERVTIVDDHGKDYLDKVEKYVDFTIVPDNKSWEREHNNCYNLYNKFDHKPCKPEDYKGEDDFKWTKNLLEHIFGEQYEMGLNYIKTLYDLPKQALPILVLISEERQTGKTTYVNYMNILFGANTVIINPQDIGNSFNGAYAEKNIIMIEESHFDSRQSLEKIKNLSTQKEILVNSKFIQQYSIPFFGKIIITSNDENKFSKVDDPEIRYWVRKIPTLKGKANHQILDVLTDEIPYFLHFLNSIESIDVTKSRMVFTEDELKTDALADVKKESRESLHKDIEIYLDQHCLENDDVPILYFISTNIKEKWFPHNHRFSTSYINRILKSNMKLEKADKTMRFVPLEQNGSIDDSIPGRPYIFENPYYDSEKVDDDGDLGVAF